jgi:hypothetical protein
MSIKEQRILLFLYGCRVVRTLLVILAYYIPLKYLSIMGFLAAILSIGWMVIWTFGLRKTGTETFGQPIWWNSLRPIHALLYGIFAYMAVNKNRNAWILLAIDSIVGFVAFDIHYYYSG